MKNSETQTMPFASPKARLSLAIALCMGLGACIALTTHFGKSAKGSRGLLFNHPRHAEEGLECTDCHDFDGGEAPFLPNHDMCSICHEIPEDQPKAESCSFCHARPDKSVSPWESIVGEDSKFSHSPHLAAELECTQCHEAPDTQPFPKGSLMGSCVDCHEKKNLNPSDCSTCHKKISRDVVPESRDGTRIAHDSLDVWKYTHGREAGVDPQFCAKCHDQESYCNTCHATEKPINHTISWNRRLHGLEATWNRQSCAVCHEEETCLKCHQNNKPTSHRGRFGSPGNSHCVKCHFPEEQNNCTVCHESISHERALVSPHALGLYPTNCAQCHPGGLPSMAPHILNSTVRCAVCHN